MISVVIPNYNRGALVCEAVKSVLNQTYHDIEVIVVDDGSTDDSVERLNSIEDSRLRIICMLRNQGACKARNIGIHEAKGDYICFLDSDDKWKLNKLDTQLRYMKMNDVDACFSAYDYIGLDGHKEVRPKRWENTTDIYEQLLCRNFVTTGTLLAKKEVFRTCLFDEKLLRYQDWDIALQISSHYKLGFINSSLLRMYEQAYSITNSTPVEKKLYSLKHIYYKFKKDIDNCYKAKKHFLWMIAMYSLCCDSDNLNPLRDAVQIDRFNIKKQIIFLLSRLGFSKAIIFLYRRDH